MPYPVDINETIETVKKLEGLKSNIVQDLTLIYPKFFCTYHFLNYLEKSLQDSDYLFKEKQGYSIAMKLFDELKKMYRRRVYIVVGTLIVYFMLGFIFIKSYENTFNFSVLGISISVATLSLYLSTKNYVSFFFSKKQREETLLKIINAGFTLIEVEKRKQFINVSEQIKQKALLN